ncbi:putative isochorismatase family protein [Lasiodiplodia theobromae]|uniref:Putative isochorismatase family protein n=1 Tax=Lasiodiplodia theobromae TaxID=45133 RepID=A0A5N5DA64_9PEZI|nr:putative isochorismatase family protein [Lasiodiplodia theobromae]
MATHFRYGLLLIDIQQGFDHPTHWGKSRSTPDFETNVASILDTFRAKVEPGDIFHVCHHSTSAASPLHPVRGNVAFQPYAAPRPDEPVFSKSVNSGFIGTNLEKAIRERKITTLVVVGLTTDHCVSTTVRMAANLHVVSDINELNPGRILLIKDATATYEKTIDGKSYDAELVHSVHLASLNNEFCEVMTTSEMISEWRLT